MLFAETFSEWLGGKLAILILGIGIWMWVLRKFAEKNPDVKDAAKKAVANKAISLIGRLFK